MQQITVSSTQFIDQAWVGVYIYVCVCLSMYVDVYVGYNHKVLYQPGDWGI